MIYGRKEQFTDLHRCFIKAPMFCIIQSKHLSAFQSLYLHFILSIKYVMQSYIQVHLLPLLTVLYLYVKRVFEQPARETHVHNVMVIR